MNAVAANPFETQTLESVLQYENPAVINRIGQKLRVSVDEATRLFNDTKLFLFLCAHSDDGPYVPSTAIDAGWHEFLMFTRDYADFCNRFFGKFLHHRPHDGTKQRTRGGAARTLRRAAEIFPMSLSINWGREEAGGPKCDADCACKND